MERRTQPCPISSTLNGPVAVMALRQEKAFHVKMDFLLRMQAVYETARMRQAEKEIDVPRFQAG